jgi:predicted outer membrane repeat protein
MNLLDSHATPPDKEDTTMLRISSSSRLLRPSVLQRLFGGRLPSRTRRPARNRLGVECLEDRTAPALFTFTVTQDSGTDDGSFSWAIGQASSLTSMGVDATINFDPSLVRVLSDGNSFCDGPGRLVLDGGGVDVYLEFGLTVHQGANVLIRGMTLETGEQQSRIDNNGTLSIEDCTLSRIQDIRTEPAVNGGAIRNTSTLTVTDSTFSGNQATNAGGAIDNDHGNLTVSGCTFSSNSAIFGGAIYNNGGSAAVTNCSFSANSVANNGLGRGGALYNQGGTLAVVNSTLDNNTSDFRGGAIDNVLGGEVTVTGSTLTGNSAHSSGGAITNESGTLTVYASTLSGNSVTAAGGTGGAVDNLDILTVNGGLVSNNSASNGGAIFNDTAGVATIGTALSGNRATNTGGALYNNGGSMAVVNAPLTSNFADDVGGAIDNVGNGQLSVTNSTLTANKATNNGGAVDNESGTLTVTGSTFASNYAANGGALANNDKLTVDGGTLAHNSAGRGGAILNDTNGTATVTATLTGNMAVNNGFGIGGAIAINGGIVFILNASLMSNSSDDLGGAIINLPAGQLTVSGSTLMANSATKNGGGIENQGALTMDGSTVSQSTAATGGGLSNESNLLLADATASITNSTFSDNSANLYGGSINSIAPLSISACTLSDSEAGITGGAINSTGGSLTIESSKITGNQTIGPDGGAIWSEVPLTVTDSTLANNSAKDSGGAIYVDGNSLTMSNSTLSANSAISGGGMYIADGASAFVHENSLFSSNTAGMGGYGGGIYVSTGGTLTTNQAMFTRNTASEGGGIESFGNASVNNSTFSLNSANLGGAVFSSYGQLSVQDSTLSGNSASTNGGGIWINSQFFIARDTITGNLTSGSGGGLYMFAGSGSVNDSTLSNNSAVNGGGVFISDDVKASMAGDTFASNFASKSGGAIDIASGGTLSLNNSALTGNTALTLGGGIENQANATISSSTISDNSGSVNGGGIDNNGGTLTLALSTLSGNSASLGGGIANEQRQSDRGPGGPGGPPIIPGILAVSDCTVAGNTASRGPGIYSALYFVLNGGTGNSVVLSSSIVAGNTDGINADIEGPVSGANNLIGNGTALSGIADGDRFGNKVGTATSPIDPRLAPLGNYRGTLQTMPLMAGSPAANTGGPLTSVTSAVGSVGSTFTLANAGAVAATFGPYVLEIDGEGILAGYDPQIGFTVDERAYNHTVQAQINPGDAVFLALDEAGRPRISDGLTDIGAVQDTVLAVTANPADTAVNAGQTATVSASARSDEPITDVEWLVSSDGGNSFHSIGRGNTTTTSDGSAFSTLPLISVARQQNGNIYEAEFSNSFGTVTTAPATLTVHYVAPPATIILGTGDDQAAALRYAFLNRLEVQVIDTLGNPAVGVPVTFTAPSSPSAGGTFAGSGSTCIVNTDDSGYAVAPIFTANATPGTGYKVTASVGTGATAISTFFHLTNYIPGAPAAVEAQGSTAQTIVVLQQPASPLEVQVTDSLGRPVPGVTVTFASQTGPGLSGGFFATAKANSLTTTAVTDGSGLAIAAGFTANKNQGTYSVTATVKGIATPATFTFTNVAGPPASIVAVGATTRSAAAGSSFGALSVFVQDQYHNLIANLPVTFTVSSSSGAGGSFNDNSSVTVTTGTTGKTLGEATTPVFFANRTAGTYQITVSAGSLNAVPAFTLTNNPGPAGSPHAMALGNQPIRPVASRVLTNASLQANVNLTATGQAVALEARRQANGSSYVAFLSAVTALDGSTQYVASIWLHMGNTWRQLSADTSVGSSGQGTLEFVVTGNALQLSWKAAGQSSFTQVGSAHDSTFKSGTCALGILDGAEIEDLIAAALKK